MEKVIIGLFTLKVKKQQSLTIVKQNNTLDPQEDLLKKDGIHTLVTLKMRRTEFSKHVWKLKTKSTNFEIKWDIMHKIGKVMNISKICKTCNLEKMEILLANKERNLNKDKNFFSSAHTLENYTLKHNLYLLFLYCFLFFGFYRILYNFLLIKIDFVLKIHFCI